MNLMAIFQNGLDFSGHVMCFQAHAWDMRDLISFAGLPPTIEYSGKSFVNTLPIPTIVPFLIWRPGVRMLFNPIQQSSSIMSFFVSLKPCSIIGMSMRLNSWLRCRTKHLLESITFFPMIVSDGISVFAPIPESSPISMLRPEPKTTFRLMVLILPHFLNMRLQRNTLKELLIFPPNNE